MALWFSEIFQFANVARLIKKLDNGHPWYRISKTGNFRLRIQCKKIF